jgi:hypothetical protein
MNIKELTEEVKKLNDLLQCPQPGLITWHSFVTERLIHLKEILEQLDL